MLRLKNVEIRNRSFFDLPVNQTRWMWTCFSSIDRDRSKGIKRMNAAPLNHKRHHEGQAQRLAVWVEIGCQRKGYVFALNLVHVGPLVAHSVGCSR